MMQQNNKSNTIVAIRMHYQIQQSRIAEICNVSRWTVVQWEAGRASPTLNHLERIADELNVSVSDILRLSYIGIKHRIRL